MEQVLLMLNVAEPIRVGEYASEVDAPYFGQYAAFSFSDPEQSLVRIFDTTPTFGSPFYGTPDMAEPGNTDQTLISDLVIGSGSYAETLPAGTQLMNWTGSIVEDMVTGNRYKLMFPRPAPTEEYPYGRVLGGRTAVFVVPIRPSTATTADFDASHDFKFVERYTLSLPTDNATYFLPPPEVVDPDPGGDSEACFAQGTLIAAPGGARPIETLRVGDQVLSHDGSWQEIRWIGSSVVDAARLDSAPNLRPILIRAGALAAGVPATDLVVSPQHRVMIRSRAARRLFQTAEALVAAKHLVGLPGIEVMVPAGGVTYWHLMLAHHDLVLGNGAWSESLYAGPMAMGALSPAHRRELRSLFPDLRLPEHRPTPARRLLSGSEGRKIAAAHLRQARRLIETV